MDTETILRRQIAELRSLLDLSYARERSLITLVNGLMFLREGAALAPDKESKAIEIDAQVRETMQSLTATPVPNHGLFADYARLAAEHAAAMHMNATLNENLRKSSDYLNKVVQDANAIRLREIELNAKVEAITRMLNRPDLIETVTAAAKEHAQARRGS